MNKGRYIDELSPGDELAGDVFVVSEVEEVNASGYRFLSMVLSDASGRRKATCGILGRSALTRLRQARLIGVYGSVQTKEKYRGQIKVETFDLLAEPEDLAPYVPPPPPDYKAHRDRFATLLKSVRDPNLYRLLRSVFDPQKKTWARFRQAVAAQGMHHAYPGGLLEHSVEVAELCDRACSVLPALKRDFLVTCALLHDIGKLEEMEHGLGAGRYTESGTLVGHVFSGAYLVRSAADGIADFPEVLKDALVHMVLSHHGRPEYGAARVPARVEAHVLAQCDMISARVNECGRAAAEGSSEGVFSVRMRGGEHLHVGDIGVQEASVTQPGCATPLDDGQGMKSQAEVSEANLPYVLRAPVPSNTVFRTTASLPVRGRVAAGPPMTSSDEDEDAREVVLPSGGADYLLHVTGDSMTGAGIQAGDLVYVRSQQTAREGDIVVAHLAGEGEVVKRFREAALGSPALLLSENPDPIYPPIPLAEGSYIQGKVVGLLRDYP